MAEIGHVKTVRTLDDGAFELDITTGTATLTASILGMAGARFHPMDGDPISFVRAGKEIHVVSVSGGEQSTNPGEVLFFSRSGAETVAAKVHLKSNGEVHVGNAADFVAMAQATNSKIEALYNAIVAAAVGSADGGATFKANISAGIEGTFAPLWGASIASGNLKAD